MTACIPPEPLDPGPPLDPCTAKLPLGTPMDPIELGTPPFHALHPLDPLDTWAPWAPETPETPGPL